MLKDFSFSKILILMSATFRLSIYLIVLGLAFLLSLLKLKGSDLSLRFISFILGLTLVSELTAYWATVRFGWNLFVYHIYAPVLLAGVSLYYQAALPLFRKYRLGWITAICGMFLSMANTRFLQPPDVFNTHFMLFEGVCIVAMALYAFYYLFTEETERRLFTSPLFWISLIFLLFWCGTFIGWALTNVLHSFRLREEQHFVYLWNWVVNLITYSGLGLVFLTGAKKQIFP